MSVERLLDSVLINLEERGWWVSGRLRSDPSLFIEFSFEDALQIPNRYWIEPTAPIIYLGLHGPKHTVAEFFLGQWVRRPLNREPLVHMAHVVLPLCNHRPRFIAPAVDDNVYLSLAGSSLHAY